MPPGRKRCLLLAVVVVVACASGVDAQPPEEGAPLNWRPSADAVAEEVLQLPEVTVRAPARLPGLPLPLAEVPATVQVITGAELRQSGVANLQEFLTRLPGVTLHDEQGNAAQPGLALRGFQ